jgi:hypothetical protein
MPWVGLEPTIPVFERAKTFHALDRAATVIGAILRKLRTLTWKAPIYSKCQHNIVTADNNNDSNNNNEPCKIEALTVNTSYAMNSVHLETAKFIARVNQPTESLSRAVGTASPYFKEASFQILAKAPVILTEISRGLIQHLQANSKILSLITP